MFLLSKPGPRRIRDLLESAAHLPAATPALLKLDGTLSFRAGFAHDFSRSRIGQGAAAFVAARQALTEWRQFDLGWVRVANTSARIAVGEMVAVEAHTAGLWSLNLSRITETIDTPVRFGFLYATTRLHIEEGQERFVVEFDPASGVVFYLIEAVSRPRHFLARVGYPFGRAMQHRFARDAHARMRRAVEAL